MHIELKQEIPTDQTAIHELHKAPFGQEEEARLVEALRKSEAFIPGLSLMAILDTKVVGHILFTKIKIRNDKGGEYDSLALAPMAVAPPFRTKALAADWCVRDGTQPGNWAAAQ